MQDVISSSTTAALSTVKNEILNVDDLVKKAEYDAKISDIESKFFTTSDYNKFTSDILNAKIKEKDLVNEFDISGFINNPDLDKKIETFEKLKTYDSSLFIGQNHFGSDGS